MAGRSIADRVEILEKKVDSLEKLPGKVDALTENVGALRKEFSQFREQNHVEHSAILEQIGQMHEQAVKQAIELHDGLRTELRGEIGGLRSDMNQRFERVDQRFDALDKRFDRLEDRLPMPRKRTRRKNS